MTATDWIVIAVFLVVAIPILAWAIWRTAQRGPH